MADADDDEKESGAAGDGGEGVEAAAKLAKAAAELPRALPLSPLLLLLPLPPLLLLLSPSSYNTTCLCAGLDACVAASELADACSANADPDDAAR